MHLSDLTVNAECSVIEALAAIDRGAAAICCVVDHRGLLLATLTDGDARRALLSGADLESPAIDFATRAPRTVRQGTARGLVLDLMQALRITAVPVLDDDGRLVGLHSLSDMIGSHDLPNSAVIMAGGKGTRLGALTKDTPKPLMTVAGRSIIEWIILGLVGHGVRNIYVSVNHLADRIVDTLGDGAGLGADIVYLRESPQNPLGTGGSLALMEPLPAEPFIVMNGDLMVDFDARQLLEHHRLSGVDITMGLRPYTHTVPFGVAEIDADKRVVGIVEKPDLQVNINAAVYCVEPDVVRQMVPEQPASMPEIVQACLDRGGAVAGWPMASDWIDIGTPVDLARAKGQAT